MKEVKMNVKMNWRGKGQGPRKPTRVGTYKTKEERIVQKEKL